MAGMGAVILTPVVLSRPARLPSSKPSWLDLAGIYLMGVAELTLHHFAHIRWRLWGPGI